MTFAIEANRLVKRFGKTLATLAGADQDPRHHDPLAGPVLPVMRHARLLHHAIARPEDDLGARDDERDLAAEDGDIVQRLRGVRFLETFRLLI